MLLGSAVLLAACARKPDKFIEYQGPNVTSLVMYKSQKVLFLMNQNTAIKTYRFQLGSQPTGHKQAEGDGRTPEGQYWIDRRNPNSSYHLSIGISYPNAADRARAEAAGVKPGGDIFIHGTPDFYLGKTDWTAGCIAVTNAEIEEIYAMVQDGTPIWIYA